MERDYLVNIKKQRRFQILDNKLSIHVCVWVFLFPVLFGNSDTEEQKEITEKYLSFEGQKTEWELNYLLEHLLGIANRYST